VLGRGSPWPTSDDVLITIGTFKRYRSLGVNEIPAEFIQIWPKTLCSNAPKLITSVWNQEKQEPVIALL
jgi:hypothetical protein